MQKRGGLALSGREVGTAGGQREAVLLPHDLPAEDLDRDVEVAHEVLDDEELLVVLLAEDRHVGGALQQELGDHRCDAVEMVGPVCSAEVLGQIADAYFAAEASGIHLRRIGREHEVRSGSAELLDVPGLVAWIGVEVLARTELDRVHEDRDHDAICLALGERYQREMPGVKRAHGGYERNALAGLAPRGEMRPQIGDGADSSDAGRHGSGSLKGGDHNKSPIVGRGPKDYTWAMGEPKRDIAAPPSL